MKRARWSASTPEAITAAIRAFGREVERVGLEAGINSAWIARGLLGAKLPMIAVDAIPPLLAFAVHRC